MFSFMLKNPGTCIALVLGAVMNVGSKINDAYTFVNAGLPHQVYEAVGAAVFFLAVALLLFRWDKERQVLPTTVPSKGRTYTPTEISEIAARKPVTGLDVVKRIERLEAASNKTETTSEAPKKPGPILYTANERDRLLEALHDVHTFLNGEPLQIALELNRLRESYYSQIEERGAFAYQNDLNALTLRLHHFWGQFNDYIHQKYRLYQDEIRYALNADRIPNEIIPMINKFSELVRGLPDKPEHKTVRILDEPFGALLDTNGVEFGAWHGGANDRIQSMMSNLRKSGVTGLEKTT